jgi:hypothetical protein
LKVDKPGGDKIHDINELRIYFYISWEEWTFLDRKRAGMFGMRISEDKQRRGG